MTIQPVILWTDALIYLLLLVIIFFVVYARKHEHLRTPWRLVWRSHLAMISAVFLAVFVIIGLLDSIHFRAGFETPASNGVTHYSGEVESLFDKLVAPLGENDEKSYSAPFATHLYSKETKILANGRVVQVYPRLKYAGKQLANPELDRAADMQTRFIRAFWQAGLLWIVVSGLLVLRLTRYYGENYRLTLVKVLRLRYQVPWLTLLLSLGVVVFLLLLAIQLATVYHIFGTDKVGQDVFYETLKSVRTGLVIGTLTTLVMLPFAVFLGTMAGFFGGRIDDIIQYVYTTLSSIPGVLLIAAAILALQIFVANHPDAFSTIAARADTRLLALCVILGVTSWTGLCRMLRGETLKLREMDYIQAAHALGVRSRHIITRHVLPNVMHIVLIAVVLDFSALVLAEAVLSYVGVGVDPTTMSWGNMINSARLELAREPVVWWPLLAAFIFMFALVLAANLFSDAIRDAFDPRIRK